MFESKNNYSLNDLSAALSWGDGGGRKQLPLPPSPDASKILSCAVLRKVGIVIHGGSLHLVFGFMGAFCVVVVRGDLFDFVWVFCCLLLFAQFLSGWNEESQGCFQKQGSSDSDFQRQLCLAVASGEWQVAGCNFSLWGDISPQTTEVT